MVGAAGVAIASSPIAALTSCTPKKEACCNTQLKISFQEGTAPRETLNEKFDYMEALGVTGFEPGGWDLVDRVNEIQQALNGRNIKVSAICAGFDGFILAEDPKQEIGIDKPLDEEAMKRLMGLYEFRRAYEADGLKKSEFITYGVTQKLLSQFVEGGWAHLETYNSNKVSSRWT